MRLTTVILIASLMQVSASTFGQRITLNQPDVPLKVVLKEIRKQSGYDIFYDNKIIPNSQKVSVAVTNATLEEALTNVFKGLALNYDIDGKTVSITKKEEPSFLDNLIAAFKAIDVMGKIVDENSQPLFGATVKIKGTERTTRTNEKGEFSFTSVNESAVLLISYLGYQDKEVNAAKELGTIGLIVSTGKLEEVNILSTGYQTIDPQKATGSFTHIDNKLLNRNVSTNILDRLNGVTSGLIFNKNANQANASAMSIRGISTIFANANPLVVIDNFHYNGDLSSINPNDVESITVLKDAAASSIWGAFSANGVIVIKTKKGKLNQGTRVEINSNITIGEKPNFYYTPQLGSANYIEVEQNLFKQGFYDANFNNTTFPIVSPIVFLLDQRRKNLISSSDSIRAINQYQNQDTRSDISKYLHRESVNQQYNLNISGGGYNSTYYFSAGYDKNLSNINRNDFDRISINAANTYSFFNKRLDLSTSIYYTKSKTANNGTTVNSPYPYLKLKDQNGNAASIPLTYNQGFVDTVGRGRLLDWHYRPLDELNLNNNLMTLNEIRLNASLSYRIIDGLNALVQYQYNQGNSNGTNLRDINSYYVRDYINKFSQYSSSTNTYSRPVPLGDILDESYGSTTSNNVRGQLNFSRTIGVDHSISALGGVEVRNIDSEFNTNRIYGYSESGSTATIDYQNTYLNTPSQSNARITSNLSQLGTTNRFLSYFANISYSYKNKYTLTGSARKDESNIFGVRSNQKGVPLWSAGASWNISREPFYHVTWLPSLKLRLSNGYQGNVDNTLSSQVTARTNQLNNTYSLPNSSLSNPPNPDLRWEKVNTTNIGIDFSIKYFLEGSIDYYVKKGSDLIGTSPVDPTTGVKSFKGNSANMAGKGMDVILNSKNLSGTVKWNTTLLYSFTKDKVTKYLLKPTNLGNAFYSPIEGNPLYSVYAFEWGGLDPTGDPQVILDGNLSKDYASIINSTNYANLKYLGSVNPTSFGSLRNEFSWRDLTLSVNLTYKFGYYFKRPSISYSSLFGGSAYIPNEDYLTRWQNPGDENKTDIPAMKFPNDGNRDFVYQNSNLLVDKGDHIRLQDISIGYQFDKAKYPTIPFNNIRIYGYINNLGIIWRANKYGVDPDVVPNGFLVIPNPTTYALGLKIGF